MTTVTVDQAKLVLNAFAATFQNNLISKDLVTWKKYDSEMNDRNALTVVEQVGPRYKVTHTTAGVQDLTSGTQDSVFGSEQFKVQDIFGSSMGWDDFVRVRDLGDARESEAIKNAALNLAEQIDAYILSVAATAPNDVIGTPGNPVDTIDDINQAYIRLKELGVEDTDLRAVMPYSDSATLATSIIGQASLVDIASGIYRQGFNGSVAGIPTLFTQQLPSWSAGSRSGGTLNGANQNVDYASVAVSGAPGQYMSQTIILTGVGAGATLVDGDVFTIAGVYAYDNRAQKALTWLQQFRVIGNYTADGSGNVTPRIFPAIIVPGVGSTTSNQNVNTAHATCSAVPTTNASLTWKHTASTAYTPRLIANKEAIQVNTADLIMPATGIAMRKSLTKIPVSVRMWRNSNFNTGHHDVRFDVVLSANVRDRRRAIRFYGQ